MPPKKRARKDVESPPPSLAPVPKPPLPPDANTGGVFELPDEIWLEILSHLPSVRIPTLFITQAPLLSSSTLEREHTLRALSQTCRAFRDLFFPELWQRFEVCATSKQVETPVSGYGVNRRSKDDFDISGAWFKFISEALEKKSNGLRQSPEHAKYVQTVSVALTRWRSATILDAFVRCLKVLPNLRTLQILRAHTQMTTHIKNAFENHKIPQVHMIVLPNHAHNALRACPEVRVVMCNYGDGGKLIGAITKECKKVEVLKGFHPDVNMMKRIIKGVPNLQEIELGCSEDVINMLAAFKHLRGIELCSTFSSDPDGLGARTEEGDLMIKLCVVAAKKILMNKAKGKSEKEKEKMWLRVSLHDRKHGRTMVKEVPLGLVNGS